MSAALSDLATAVAQHPPGAWGPGPWGAGWWFLFIPLFWIALIAILFAVFGRRWRRGAAENGYGPHAHRAPARHAETTLAERFAQGDIDEVEYRARLEVLRANETP